MTISSIERPASIQHATRHHTINHTESHEATRSEVEGHIQMLINEGNVFEARYYMNMVNKLNGYPVISQMDFKRWHISYLRNQKSNSKNHFSNIKIEKLQKESQTKYQNQNPFSKYQKPNQLNGNQISNIKSGSFQSEFTKAYMKLISY